MPRHILAPMLLAFSLLAQGAHAQTALIPQPDRIESGQGSFTLNRNVRIVAPADRRAQEIAAFLRDGIREDSGIALRTGAATDQPRIELRTDPSVKGEEAYRLTVTPQRIEIAAAGDRGLFWGVQTLRQLLPSGHRATLSIAAVRIDDAPRYAWRGVMLDAARHFIPVPLVKQQIDLLSRYKLNVLHWHLTDDQGWRIEIKRYPKLTEVGAWRRPAGAAGTDTNGQPVRYGGFYTQDEIRDIVRYAAARYVTIVPEIDMPGHMQAAIAAYPELGSIGDAPVVSPDWGVHTYLVNTDDGTIAFLENVLDEVTDLFPGPYIHIGGDEAVKDQWKASPRVQARMRELGIRDENAMQGWLLGQIEKHLAARGKRIVGWDEILEGGVPPNAIVMSWRGAKGGVEAARAGHDVVMAPDPDLYFDHLQTDEPDVPGRPTLRTLADIYAFEPVPSDMTPDVAARVLGAQAELWTEHMRTEERVEHAAFPRLDALAEVLWSPKAARDWGGFVARIAPEIERQRALGVRVAERASRPARTDPLTRTSSALKPCSGKLRLRLEDDAPANGPRAVFDTDLFDPCWIFEHAPLDGIGGIAVDVGQIPYNFQLAHDITGIVPRPAPTSAQGDLLVTLDGCNGTPLATIPLDQAAANPAITTLTASWPPIAGAHDLCFVFAYRGHDPLWSIDKVRLVPAH